MLATAAVRRGLKDDAPGYIFHFPELLAQGSVVGHSLFHFGELFRSQGDGNGFLSDFAGPLITGAATLPGGPVLHGALADEAELAQLAS